MVLAQRGKHGRCPRVSLTWALCGSGMTLSLNGASGLQVSLMCLVIGSGVCSFAGVAGRFGICLQMSAVVRLLWLLGYMPMGKHQAMSWLLPMMRLGMFGLLLWVPAVKLLWLLLGLPPGLLPIMMFVMLLGLLQGLLQGLLWLLGLLLGLLLWLPPMMRKLPISKNTHTPISVNGSMMNDKEHKR